MNERIKELMEQAGLYDFVIESMGIDEEMEKFAELIVRDIHQYVDNMDTAQIISNGILKRYGMEE
jgi:cobalamin biosynthesis Mg chelatase CobN